LGIGDWGLGIGPNPQSPIPKFNYILINNNFKLKHLLIILNKKDKLNKTYKYIYLISSETICITCS